jgi:hypothetical protein
MANFKKDHIYYGNMKPENVMLRKDYTLAIENFETAIFLGE